MPILARPQLRTPRNVGVFDGRIDELIDTSIFITFIGSEVRGKELERRGSTLVDHSVRPNDCHRALVVRSEDECNTCYGTGDS